jgi:hypothetical protein
MRGKVLVICPTRQAHSHATCWRDGQITHGVHARTARRATAAPSILRVEPKAYPLFRRPRQRINIPHVLRESRSVFNFAGALLDIASDFDRYLRTHD